VKLALDYQNSYDLKNDGVEGEAEVDVVTVHESFLVLQPVIVCFSTFSC